MPFDRNMKDLIVNVALTGNVHMKTDNPSLPVTPDEVVADAKRCRDAGACIVHVHARDSTERPTYRKEIFREIVSGIRSECPDLIICSSTSGRIFSELQHRSEALESDPQYRPDMASLTLGSMNFLDRESVNPPSTIRGLALTMKQRGIVPELEIFDMGMIDFSKYLIAKRILQEPLYYNLLLGSLGTLNATPLNLTLMVQALPRNAVWSAGGLGRYQFFVNSMAITMGGHVRVGLEDSLHYDSEKSHLASNAGLVDRVVKLALAAGREIATPAAARRIIGLSNPDP